MRKLVAVPLWLSLLAISVRSVEWPVRQTANGPVEGLGETSALGQQYYAFRGIPFAEPPITGTDPYTGEEVDRRFKAPEPLRRKWTENLKVHTYGDSCLVSSLIIPVRMNISEDCLSLNVYVPVGGAEKKTVIVVIHGGGFTEGDYTESFYGPDFLLTADNIVVTIEYRVGIFGFLNLGTNEYSGNMGLKDQQLAMKWVYENIENFSGNKDEILLYGISAGGASVSYHILNEESRKYFNRAYAASGSAFNYFALTRENHLERMQECSKAKNSNEIIEYMKTADSKVLAECYFDINWGKTIKPKWVPTIEKPGTKGAFITQSPEEIYSSDKPPVVDALFSFASKEQIVIDNSLLISTEPLIKLNWKESTVALPFDDFNGNTHPKEYKEVLEKLRAAYYSNASDSVAIINANIDLMSDINFADGILKNFVLQTKANNKGADEKQHKNTFMFRFGLKDELNTFQCFSDSKFDGATHGDDMCYLFYCHVMDEYKFYDEHLMGRNSSAYRTIIRMVKMVTNFARTGITKWTLKSFSDPSIEGDTPFKLSTSASEIFCQEIDNDPKSAVTTNIKEQLHYDVWREIEQIYHTIRKSHSTSKHQEL